MFVEFQVELLPIPQCLKFADISDFLSLVLARNATNGMIATRANRSQNWQDNQPDPCEQSTFPFQKSDRYDPRGYFHIKRLGGGGRGAWTWHRV